MDFHSIRASYSHESVVDGGAPRGRPLKEVVELRLCDKVNSLSLLHDLYSLEGRIILEVSVYEASLHQNHFHICHFRHDSEEALYTNRNSGLSCSFLYLTSRRLAR